MMKTSKLFLILLSSLLFGFACTNPKTQIIAQGKIRYKISYFGNLNTGTPNLMPNALLLHFKDNKLRLTFKGGLGELKPVVLIDGMKAEITVLKTVEKMAETRSLLAKDTSLKNSHVDVNYMGYNCHSYIATNKNTKYEIIVAEKIPLTMKGTSRLEGFYLSDYKGFPLKIVDKEQDFTIVYEAENISSEPQNDTIFMVNP